MRIGLCSKILDFFKIDNSSNPIVARSVMECWNHLSKKPEHEQPSLASLVRICRALERECLLISAGQKPLPLCGDCYVTHRENEMDLDYGSADFIVFGFTCILEHFKNSVSYITVVNKKGDHDIGTCFIVDFCPSPLIITAAHCIQGMRSIKIADTTIQGVRRVTRSIKYDIAGIWLEEPGPFASMAPFKLGIPAVLDEILTIGYPKVPGFDLVQVSEKSQVVSQKAIPGDIVGSGPAYLEGGTGEPHLLLNAKVKGGSSGCPIIGRDGKVVGVVTDLPQDGEGNSLGYIAGCPATAIKALATEIEFQDLPFELNEDGLSVTQTQ